LELPHPRPGSRRVRWPVVAGALALAVAASSLVLGLDRLLGPGTRHAGLLLADASAPATAPDFNELPRGGAFFQDRDSITVTVPRAMTVAEFLSLYHLENHRAVRAALSSQAGATEWNDVIEEGARVSFRLTRGREDATGTDGEAGQ